MISKTNNHLKVVVQDHHYDFCNSANVKIRNTETEEWVGIPFEKEQNCYPFSSFKKGSYILRVTGKKGWTTDERILDLDEGQNFINMSIAPNNTPYYTAADKEKVFFSTDDSKMLLYIAGKEEKTIADFFKKHKINSAKPYYLAEEKKAEGSIRYAIDLPNKKAERIRMLDTISEVIATSGFTVHFAQPIIKGEFAVEGLTNELIVKFKSHVTKEEVQRLAKSSGFVVVRAIKYLGNAYLMRVGKYPDYEILKIVQSLTEKWPVVWLEINRIESITNDIFTPNDFLYPEQPHFQLINADDAWDTLDDINVNLRSGNADITIAVFDVDGVSPNHPDLTGNLTDGTAKMIANFDFANWQNQTVANLGGDHGTKCASSATGRFNNTTGATGLAGNCHLIGASLGNTLLDQADAWMWAAGFQTGNTNPSFPGPVSNPADVISNSWGASGAALSNTYKDAFDFLTTYGRNGRGCVVCFSLGNTGYVDFTSHPTRRRMYAAYAKTVAVGASINSNPTNPVNSSNADHNGNTNNLPAVVDTRAYYSPYGPSVDIVAPSHTSYFPNKIDSILSAVSVNQGDVIGNATSATTLQSAANAGNTSITVNDTTGFSTGEFLLIGISGGANREYLSITNVSGNQITVSIALQNSYAAGTSVATGPNDYSIDFGGTSHSCPTVAGAAALMLSVKPELNWVQVRETLRNTAVRIDFTQTNAIGQWVDNDGDGVNEFSQWYGYGRLDVDAAVIATRDADTFADIVIRDNLEDTGIVPSAGWHAHSPDIWVSQSNDAIPSLAYSAGPSHQNAKRGQDNYIYLRVKNVGGAASNEVYLRSLITHFPGFEFRYPQEWQPSNRPGQAVPSPLTTGTYLIGETLIDNLAVGADTIVKMTWDSNLIPPETVMVGGVSVDWHPCILAEASPHDGPLPASSGHAVKDYNNLAHRNIRIENEDDSASSDDFAVGVVAGTSDRFGVASIILDRSFLPLGYRVFIKTADDSQMAKWIEAARTNNIGHAEPLPGSEEGGKENPKRPESSGKGCGITILDPTRLAINCCDGNQIIIHAPERTRIETHCKDQADDRPSIKVGRYQNQEVLVLEGGTKTIELPFKLPSGEYSPLVIGIMRPSGQRNQGYLKATQRKTNGELSAGYTIEG